MRIAAAVVVLMCATGITIADDATSMRVSGEWGPTIELDYSPLREPYYSQIPNGYGLNASSAFGSELADDIPSDLAGIEIIAVTATLPEPVMITETLSIGGLVDITYSTEPYNGLGHTELGDSNGCELYVDHEFWGDPRWTSVWEAFGVTMDLAYSLYVDPPVSTETTSWAAVKDLYH
ncbi:hypothetical protein ACFL6M_01790 [Candidatus Eisenbacteria bacterium]|uniref:Uncharacterized protein n=1 Tax=Eiseniibacteriota bacterium TaxID=2212470 RepID=A0ABV6YIY7_UNCEI